ncbi:MAG: hypothetical protein LUF92_17765 [Clostridiales bacterium]|nr:hypothetical protein [Clostridiales bacterium]
MEQIDTKRLETAIAYLQRIADGKNPVNNMPMEDDAVLNNPNVVRCMFFVKEVLEEVRRNEGFIGTKPKKPPKEDFPIEVLQTYAYRADQTITRFVAQLNEPVDTKIFQKLNFKTITDWLKENDYLTVEQNQEYGKKRTVPTEKGMQIGLSSEERVSFQGVKYLAVIYGEQAQEFVVAHIKEMLEVEKQKKQTEETGR